MLFAVISSILDAEALFNLKSTQEEYIDGQFYDFPIDQKYFAIALSLLILALVTISLFIVADMGKIKYLKDFS